MRNLLKMISTFLLLFVSSLVSSQNLENFEKFIVNEWTLEKHEINGQVLPPKAGHEKDQMIFTKDFTSKSISKGVSDIGSWKFDSTSGIFSVSSNRNDFIDFRVISISEKQCVLEMETPQKQKIILYLTSEKK